MLVLTRLRDQAIIIGHDVEVTVIDIRGDKVRLGIAAPKDVSVHRKEIYEHIRLTNQSAAKLAPGDVPPTPGPGLAPVPLRPGGATPHGGPPPSASSRPPPPPPSPSADPFLLAALDEARQGLKEGGVPIGSVLVRDGTIIAAGHNRRVQKNDAMAHAEIDCLRRAGRQKTYKDTVLYSTLMPCFLCSGAVVQFGIPRVVVGESVNFHGAPDFLRSHGVHVQDLHDSASIQLMADFIKAHPDLWHEDIGK